MTILTPYLPDDAKNSIREHYASKKMPAFLKAVDLGEAFQGYCKNCAGLGVVIIQFADKGPYHEVPTTSKPITWFEGDGTAKQGWYIIGRTVEFTCPHCKGERHVAIESAKQPIDGERKFHRPQALEHLFEKVQP